MLMPRFPPSLPPFPTQRPLTAQFQIENCELKIENYELPIHIPLAERPFSRPSDAGRSGDAEAEMRGKFFFPQPFCFDLHRVTFLSPGKFQILLKVAFLRLFIDITYKVFLSCNYKTAIHERFIFQGYR